MDVYGKGTTGRLLVSSPRIESDIFNQSVILMLGHDEDGAIGVIINRQTHTLNLRDLCREIEVSPDHVPRNKIRFGGPVSIHTGVVVHSHCYHHKTSVDINRNCRVTACADVLA